jgi:hypothetical protein
VAVSALLDLKALPPHPQLPKTAKGEVDEKQIRTDLTAAKTPAWVNHLLVEREVGADGKPVKGPDGQDVPNPVAKEYVQTLQNTITRLESQIKPTYFDLYYEQTRCVTRANYQLLKDKPDKLAGPFGTIAQQIHATESSNPDLPPEVKGKFSALREEFPALKAEYEKLGAVGSAEPPPAGDSQPAAGAAAPTAPDAPKTAAATPPEEDGGSTGLIVAGVVALLAILGVVGYFALLRKPAPPPRRAATTFQMDPDQPE